jgi:NitT/TauT family transport system permease protein
MKRLPMMLVGWALLALAYVIASLLVADPVLLPDLGAVLIATSQLFGGGGGWAHVLATVRETGIAVLLSVTAGVPLGLVVGSVPRLRTSLEPPIDWMRSIPATALFPLTLLFFGSGAQSRIAIATYGSIFPVVISTMYGAAEVDPDRLRHAHRCGLGGLGKIIHVVAWGSLASVLAGIRLAISASLVLVVVGEMFIGAQRGAGLLIVQFQTRYQTAEMFGVILVLGFVGYTLNRVFQQFESGVKEALGEGST